MTPRRSMSTGLPRSASSSASDSRSRTIETEYFFICTLYTTRRGAESAAFLRSDSPSLLLPGDLHAEEVQEDLPCRLVLRIRLRTPDVEIDLLRCGIGLAARQPLTRQRVVDPQ